MAVHPFWPSTLFASHSVDGWLLLPACGLPVTAVLGLSIAVPLP